MGVKALREAINRLEVEAYQHGHRDGRPMPGVRYDRLAERGRPRASGPHMEARSAVDAELTSLAVGIARLMCRDIAGGDFDALGARDQAWWIDKAEQWDTAVSPELLRREMMP